MASIRKLTDLAGKHLEPGETILSVVKGTYDAAMFGKRRNTYGDGILMATDEKVVLYGKKWTGYELKIVPYASISSVEMDKGLSGYRVTVVNFGNEPLTMKWINSDNLWGIDYGDANQFVEDVKAKIMEHSQQNTQSESGVDVADQIRKFAELKSEGIITDEEFESKKQALLAKL